MWYTLSCWLFSKSCINQVQRLIRNFLWTGTIDHTSRAKVAWSIITLPTSSGGLGIIDPVAQSKALLAKMVVRSLQPGEEVWKTLMKRRMSLCSPVVGGPWKSDIRWIFNKDMKLKCSLQWEDKFINGIWRAWSDIRKGLELRHCSCKEELLRQPLIRNPRHTDTEGFMLGIRTRLAWGRLDAGPGSTLQEWTRFTQSPQATQDYYLSQLRGGHTMAGLVQ